jgi:hypothetical protein
VGRRELTIAVLVGTVAVLVISLLARALPVTGMASLVMAVGAPYVAVAAFLAFAVAFWRRRTWVVLAALLLATAAVAVQVSWYWLGRPARAAEHVDIRVLATNINRG